MSSVVDVIIPCYRYGRFLGQCTESVLTQSGVDVRVLIIDDASPDNSAEIAADIARGDSRVTLLRHSKNKGHIATNNEGIEWASGNYLLVLSADDYLLPGALQRAADLMDAHPDVGLTFGKSIDLKGDVAEEESLANRAVDSVTRDARSSVLSGEAFAALIESFGSTNVVPAPTAVVRTDLQKRLGGYRPELPHAGDLELWLRFAAHARVGVFAEFQAVYRFHGDNMQNSYYRDYLPDLVQRKAALDSILEYWRVSDGHRLHQRLLAPLADEALVCANRAFSQGNAALAQKLSAFAVTVNPSIRRTRPWATFSCKCAIGPKGWQALRSTYRWMIESR